MGIYFGVYVFMYIYIERHESSCDFAPADPGNPNWEPLEISG